MATTITAWLYTDLSGTQYTIEDVSRGNAHLPFPSSLSPVFSGDRMVWPGEITQGESGQAKCGTERTDRPGPGGGEPSPISAFAKPFGYNPR